MSPEEIRQTLWRTLAKLDELYGDRTNAEELIRSEREAHKLEMDNINAAMATKDRKLAENEARIAALEKELELAKAANVDANPPLHLLLQGRLQRQDRLREPPACDNKSQCLIKPDLKILNFNAEISTDW